MVSERAKYRQKVKSLKPRGVTGGGCYLQSGFPQGPGMKGRVWACVQCEPQEKWPVCTNETSTKTSVHPARTGSELGGACLVNIRQVCFWFVCFCKAVEVYSFKEDTLAKVFQNQGHTYAFLGHKVATGNSAGHTQEPARQLLSSLS